MRNGHDLSLGWRLNWSQYWAMFKPTHSTTRRQLIYPRPCTPSPAVEYDRSVRDNWIFSPPIPHFHKESGG